MSKRRTSVRPARGFQYGAQTSTRNGRRVPEPTNFTHQRAAAPDKGGQCAYQSGEKRTGRTSHDCVEFSLPQGCAISRAHKRTPDRAYMAWRSKLGWSDSASWRSHPVWPAVQSPSWDGPCSSARDFPRRAATPVHGLRRHSKIVRPAIRPRSGRGRLRAESQVTRAPPDQESRQTAQPLGARRARVWAWAARKDQCRGPPHFDRAPGAKFLPPDHRA
jgi:hypothetical protein